jgi:subtilisin
MLSVGVIDSGVNTALLSGSKSKISGVHIFRQANGAITVHPDDLVDHLNHGTICIRIIEKYVRSVHFEVIKIFDHVPTAHENVLIKAIEWCIERKVDVINLSLGIESETMSAALIEICDLAYEKNIPIIAASHNNFNVSFPAFYPKVFSVGKLPGSIDSLMYLENSPINFFTKGDVIADSSRFSGSSFACSRITGEVLQIFTEKGKLSVDSLKEELIRKAQVIKPATPVFGQRYSYTDPYAFDEKEVRPIAQRYLKWENKYPGVNNIVIVPLRNENLQFLQREGTSKRFKSPFKIVKEGITILKEKAKWNKFDTVAMGGIDEAITFAPPGDFVFQLKELLLAGKHFIVFDKITFSFLNEIKSQLNSSSQIICHFIDAAVMMDFFRFKYLPKSSIPVIACIGMAQNSSLEFQVAIKEVLSKSGWVVEYLSPFSEGDLSSASFSFPVMSELVNLKSDQKKELVGLLVKSIDYLKSPDLILTGVPGRLVPASLNGFSDLIDPLNFLSGVKPDAVILYINENDSYESILDEINVTRSFLKSTKMCVVASEGLVKTNASLVKKLYKKIPVIAINELRAGGSLSVLIKKLS